MAKEHEHTLLQNSFFTKIQYTMKQQQCDYATDTQRIYCSTPKLIISLSFNCFFRLKMQYLKAIIVIQFPSLTLGYITNISYQISLEFNKTCPLLLRKSIQYYKTYNYRVPKNIVN